MATKTPDDKKLLLMPPSPEAGQQTAVAEADACPETTAISFTGPLTRDSLTEYTEAQHLKNAKRVVPRIYRTLVKGLDGKGLDAGEIKALEYSMEAFGLRSKGSGVMIINNLLQQNNNINGGSRDPEQGVYFESILRKIEKEEQVNRREIIDVEPE